MALMSASTICGMMPRCLPRTSTGALRRGSIRFRLVIVLCQYHLIHLTVCLDTDQSPGSAQTVPSQHSRTRSPPREPENFVKQQGLWDRTQKLSMSASRAFADTRS